MNSTAADSYFERLGEHSFRPTPHTGGGWDTTELHFSPLGGLMVHEMLRHIGSARDGMVLSRVAFDILGRLANDVCEVSVETIRPGRTIELIEATLSIQGRAVIRARAWLMAVIDTTPVEGSHEPAFPAPESVPAWDFGAIWPGGFVGSVQARRFGEPEPGRTTAWLTTDVTLVAGEDVSELAAFVALADTANGIAIRQQVTDWMFPNVDLVLHLFRQPRGRWIGFDTSVAFGPTGQGLTSSVLHDVDGPVGSVQQLLTVRPIG